jgi:hypothetical protein
MKTWNYRKKRYFREPGIREIKAGKQLQGVSQDLVFHILTLNRRNTALVLPPLIPKNSAKRSKKKGRVVELADTRDLEAITNLSNLDPRTVRENAFDQVSAKPHFGYIYYNPETGKKVQILLADCIEATWLFTYPHQGHLFVDPITVESYTGEGGITSPERLGGQFIVTLPSRGKGVDSEGRTNYPSPHIIKVDNIAIYDNEHKIRIAWRVTDQTEHSCPAKTYGNLKFPTHPRLCVHDITAVLAVVDQQAQSGNVIPYQTTPIAIPTELTVDYYMKLIDNCLVEQDGKARKLNLAEREVLLWGLVNKLGYDETFNPQGKKLRDYDFHRII